MTHYSIKEAAGFRKASDYVLKGIFNTYRKDPAFRKFYKLDDIRNLQRGRNKALWDSIQRDDKKLINILTHRVSTNAPISKRALRQAEFARFKEQLGVRNLMNPWFPFINRNNAYINGPFSAPNTSSILTGGPGTISGGFDPIIFPIMKYQGRAPSSWTQILGHELGHSILRDMVSHRQNLDAQTFRQSVLKNYRTNFTPSQRKAALKYSVASGNTKALSLLFTDHRDFFRNPKKHAATFFQMHPELDERVADAIAMSVGQGNPSINRAIANHFNRYYRNVKGPVGWRARHLLRSE